MELKGSKSACTFKGFLASYDSDIHPPYIQRSVFLFSRDYIKRQRLVEVHTTSSCKIKVRYEHVILKEKMFRSFFTSIWAKIHSLWAFITRKKLIMAGTISLNVLVVAVEKCIHMN